MLVLVLVLVGRGEKKNIMDLIKISSQQTNHHSRIRDLSVLFGFYFS